MEKLELELSEAEKRQVAHLVDRDISDRDDSYYSGIVLNPDFMERHPEIDRLTLIGELLFGKYDIRRFPFNATNGIGTTNHKGRPVTLITPITSSAEYPSF